MKRYSKLETSKVIQDKGEFIERLVKFDASNNCSLIHRILNRNSDICEVISHSLDRYLLSLGEDSVKLPKKIYDSVYEREISKISHNIEDGKITVHFSTGGYTDFYNISRKTMEEIADSLMELQN